MLKRLLCFGLFALIPLVISAQYYQTGTEATSIKWRIIFDKNINVIFPSSAELFASYYLNSLLIADSLTGSDYGIASQPIDVILHNNNIQSNGFVSWAPRRMELITFPLDNENSELWINNLSIHETRHVKQMNRLNTNFIKGLSYIIGEQAVGISAAQVPGWFLEGDAVFTETKYTNSGRGRNASFYQYYRAHFLERNNYFKYDKWLNGSYKDYIPNRYSFGFQIVNFANLRFGENTWNNVLNFVSKRPYTIGPFYFGVKKFTGLSPRRLSNATFLYADSLWSAESSSKVTLSHQISKNNKSYTNYLYPFTNSDGQTISYKTSLKRVPEFVLIDSLKNESTILHTGSLIGQPYIDDSLIVWSEFKANLRWEQVSYGRVVKFNYRKNEKIIYPQRGIYFEPIFSDQASSVVALHYANNGVTSLRQLYSNGDETILFTFDLDVNPQELEFDGGCFYVLATSKCGKKVYKIDSAGNYKVILSGIYADIESLSVSRGNIFFSATEGFTKNIFCHNIYDNKTYRVIKSRFGSNYPSQYSVNKLIYSNYSVDGFSLCSSTIEMVDSVDLKQICANVSPEISSTKNKISGSDIFSKIYPSKPYTKFRNLFNFHSWLPFFVKPTMLDEGEFDEINLGATVMSQNLTGTTVFTAGYGYSFNSDYNHLFNATLEYSGLYPKFSLSFDVEQNNAHLILLDSVANEPSIQRKSLSLFTSVPLCLTSSNIITYIQPFASFVYDNSQLLLPDERDYRSGMFNVNNGLYFSSLSRMAHRDLHPRWGATMQIIYNYRLFSFKNYGSLVAAVSKFYLPGFFSNHSIRLNASFQHQNLETSYMKNKVTFPRGYSSLLPSENFWGIATNYEFPLFYPDFNIGMLTYIKRFSLNLFYDYAENTQLMVKNDVNVRRTKNLRSCGFEISSDFHLFRTSFPFRITYQFAWLNNNPNPVCSFNLYYSIN